MRAVSLVIACVLVIGCAASAAQTKSDYYTQRFQRAHRGSERLAAAAAARDEAAIAALLAPELVFGGAWFTDAECRLKFSAAGPIPSDQAQPFAHCLATLGLVPAKYGTTHPEILTYTHGPGFLLEARFDPDHGGHLVYLGYASRRSEQEALPVVTDAALLDHRSDASAFELDAALRGEVAQELADVLQVDPAQIDDAVVAKLDVWLRVCIDASGAVTSAGVRDARSIVLGEALAAWARTWTFRPFQLGGQAIPVCSVVYVRGGHLTDLKRLSSPVPATEGDAVMVPPLAKLLRSGIAVVTPSPEDKTLLRERGNPRVVGVVGFCIDTAGAVTTTWLVLPTNLPDYDARVRAGAAAMAYRPYVVRGRPRPVCSMVTYVYNQR